MNKEFEETISRDEHGFSSPVLKRESGFRKNPVYRTVEQLMTERSPLIAKYRIEHGTKERKVYYFYLKTPAPRLVFSLNEGPVCKNRHFTLDQQLNDKPLKKGDFSGCLPHYTEVYDEMTLHVFFTPEGDYHATHAKRNEEALSDHPVLLSSTQIEALLFNAEEARELFLSLIYETQHRYAIAAREAEEHHTQLCEISRGLNGTSLADYIAVGQKFVCAVDAANDANTNFYDPRAQFIRGVLQKLQDRITTYSVKQESSDDVSQPSIISLSVPAPTVTLPHEVADLSQQHYLSILQLEKELDKLEQTISARHRIEDLIEREILRGNIQIELLKISTDYSSLRKEQKFYLKTLNEKIDHIDDLLVQFEQQLWTGNVETIAKIYPHVVHRLQPYYIIEHILFKLIESPWPLEKKPIISQNLDYLNTHSISYQLIIKGIGIYMAAEENIQAAFSFLGGCVLRNNLVAFELLINQGMDPNHPAALINSIQIPILYWIFERGLKNEMSTEFIDILLRVGVDISMKPKAISFNFRAPRRLRSFSKLITQSSAIFSRWSEVTPEYYKSLLKVPSVIYLLATGKHINSLNALLPHLSFEDLLWGTSLLSTQKGIKARTFCPVGQTVCGILEDPKYLPRLTEEIQKISQPAAEVSIFFYPSEPTHIPTLTLLEKFLNAFFEKCAELMQRDKTYLEKMFDERVIRYKDKLENLDTVNKEMAYLIGCLFLTLACDSSTEMTQRRLMQIFCYIGALSYKSEEMWPFHNYYKFAQNIANYSRFSSQLIASNLYRHAVNKSKQPPHAISNSSQSHTNSPKKR